MCVAIFKNGLRAGKFNDELNEHPPRSFEELKAKADTFIRIEGDDLDKKRREGGAPAASQDPKGKAAAADPPKSRKDNSRQYRQNPNQGAGKWQNPAPEATSAQPPKGGVNFIRETVTSQLDDWPHGNNTSLSSALCPHSRTSRENFPGGHPSQYYSKASTLNHGVFMSWAPEKKTHLVVMSSTNQIFYALLNCIVPYLYSLGFASCSGAVSVQSCVPPPSSLPGD